MNRLRTWWDALRTSLWFVPSQLVLCAIISAALLIFLDSRLDTSEVQKAWPHLFGAGADGAREMLSVIASSMITVAGVAFSITIVALVLASSQYTSRILRNFMRDRANQLVLGSFVSIYVYCLVVLRSIRGSAEGEFVPSLAVLFAVFLAFVGIGSLIYFIHHIASSIQAEQIVRAVAEESIDAIERLFPIKMSEPLSENLRLEEDSQERIWKPVKAGRTGYLEGIEYKSLLNYAVEKKIVLRMERGIGEFVAQATPLISVHGTFDDDQLETKLNSYFTIGFQRTMVQDLGFGIRQIVDVALKALSPGINDTTTGVTCINYLTAIFSHLATRRVTTDYGIEDSQRRVFFRGPTFESLLGDAFDQIRQNAEGNVSILRSLIQTFEVIAGQTQDRHRHQLLLKHANLVAAVARRTIPEPRDREGIDADLRRFEKSLEMRQSISQQPDSQQPDSDGNGD